MIDYVNAPTLTKAVAVPQPSDFTKVVIALPFAALLLVGLPSLLLWGLSHAG
jgi:hypothetical protein